MEKQIEEMAKDVLNSSILSIEDASDVAKSLYERGYRKASSVAEETMKEFKALVTDYVLDRGLNLRVFQNAMTVAERKIKKKYTKTEGEE